LWIHTRESIKGESAEELCKIARQTHLDQVARHYLDHGTLRQQLLAIVMLGHLKDRAVWGHLVILAQDANMVRSLEAARALVRIDAPRAVPVLVPLIARRLDWSPLNVLKVLESAGHDLVSRALGEAAQQASPLIAARLIRYLAMTYSYGALPLIRPLLSRQPLNEDLLASCLLLFGQCADPQDLPTVRQYLTHPTWFIRVHAATALGRMGVEEDQGRLVSLLDDPHWWVRYRAAEALSALPWMTEARLSRLLQTLPTVESRAVLIPFLAKRGTTPLSLSTAVSSIGASLSVLEPPPHQNRDPTKLHGG
jgi:HEAT repeat protein